MSCASTPFQHPSPHWLAVPLGAQSTAASTGDGSVDERDEPSCAPTTGGIGLAKSHHVLSFFDIGRGHKECRGGDGQEEASEDTFLRNTPQVSRRSEAYMDA